MLVVGLGNELRHDDGAGIAVARRLRGCSTGFDVVELPGEASELILALEGREAVVAVDTIRSGAPAGAIVRLDASRNPLPASSRGSSSTHAIGLAEAIELARALRRLPGRVVVYGVEGRRFDAGRGLSGEVSAVLPKLTEIVLAEARRLCGAVIAGDCATCPGGDGG